MKDFEQPASSNMHRASSIQRPVMSVIDGETRRFGRVLHYAGALVAALCAMAGYSLLHVPTMHAISETSIRIEEVLLSVQNAPIIRDQHQKVSATLEDVTSRIAEVQRRVPREADAGTFLKEITQIAGSDNIAIKDFQPEQPLDKSGYAEMAVTLKGHGSFAGICTFIDRLAKLKRLSKVKDLKVSSAEDSTDYPMTATLLIYFALESDKAKPAQEDRRG
jgi:Tfp pilus assembly protein PilO